MSKKLFYLFLFFSLFLTACANNKEAVSEDNWESEVLWAEECGQDGLACCLDAEPACKFGQTCCVSPLDSAQTYCADVCRFGQLDEFCRATAPACDSGMICADYGRCAACGDAEQPCCGNDECGDGLLCNRGTCQECGLPGNVCCDGAQKCLNENDQDENRTECQLNNICSYCGSKNNIACQAEPRCNAGCLLNNEQCYACGGANQPCCRDENGESYCDETAGLVCNLGFCAGSR